MAGAGATAASAPAQRLDPRVVRLCAVVLIGPLMAQMDVTVVNVSLSTMQRDLHASLGAAQWIVAGYLLALALTLPLNAWLVDRLGARRLYLACFSAFTLASVLCGLATTMSQLVAARVLQGAAGGLLAPMAQMMLARVAGRHLARLLGYSAMPVLLAPLVGPSVAGAILKHASWHWLFYVNLPIGVLAVLASAAWLPTDGPAPSAKPFDGVGFVFIAPGLAALLYGLDQLPAPAGALATGLGAGLLLAFAAHARRHPESALMDLRLLRVRDFRIAIATQSLWSAATFGGQLLVPLYLIVACGVTPTRAGLMLAPMGLGMLLVFPTMGALTERFGCRRVAVVGAGLSVLGTVFLVWMAWSGLSPLAMTVCLVLRGMGQGATGVPAVSAGYAAVPKDRLPVATTTANIVQRVGGPIGTTVFSGLVAAASSAGHPGTTAVVSATGFTTAFTALVLLQLLVFATAARLPIRLDSIPAAPRP